MPSFVAKFLSIPGDCRDGVVRITSGIDVDREHFRTVSFTSSIDRDMGSHSSVVCHHDAISLGYVTQVIVS